MLNNIHDHFHKNMFSVKENLQDLLEGSLPRDIVKNIPKELKHFVPSFEYVLFDTKNFEDHAIIQHFKRPTVKIGVWFMKRSDNLIGFIQENPRLTREILREIKNIEKTNIQTILVYLNNVSGMAPEKIDQIIKRPLQYFHSP